MKKWVAVLMLPMAVALFAPTGAQADDYRFRHGYHYGWSGGHADSYRYYAHHHWRPRYYIYGHPAYGYGYDYGYRCDPHYYSPGYPSGYYGNNHGYYPRSGGVQVIIPF